MKRSFVILSLLGSLALPTSALAQCDTMVGSYAVTCEKGVQVYRHQALSPLPAVSQVEITRRKALAQQDRRIGISQQLQARQVAIAERAQRAQANDLIYTRRGFNRRGINSRRVLITNRGRGISRGYFRTAKVKY